MISLSTIWKTNPINHFFKLGLGESWKSEGSSNSEVDEFVLRNQKVLTSSVTCIIIG